MRKLIFSLLACCMLAVNAAAQVDIQLHYDLGRALYNSLNTRPWVTTTVEMFKADKWGSTYFFVDMDYTDKGVDAAYWEISRELKFWKAPISAHVEYNGGLNYINNAFLGGAAYNWNSADFSRVFGLQLLSDSDMLFVCGSRISQGMRGEILHAVSLNMSIYTFDDAMYVMVQKLVTQNGGNKSLVKFKPEHYMLSFDAPLSHMQNAVMFK